VKVRRYYGLVALAALPLLIGLLLALALQGGLADNPLFRLQARLDLGTLLLFVGLALTLCLAAGVVAWQWFDRRQRRALAAVQEETAQARQRFIRRLDHELKNPLAAIRTTLTYLTIGSDQQKETQAWQDISAQVERLSRLTADLRKVAELETRPIECEPINVAELLAELVTAVQTSPEYANHAIRLLLPQAPWPLPVVTGDRDLLGLAFYNLLDNACKFTRPEDVIELRAAEDGPWLVVEVADTGPGIVPEELPHLFEELYRGRNARQVAGSGLGLALAQRIAARHGATITVRSRLEQGTVFTLRLPLPA
jgi:two-component system, OmpR family, sensor kinase